MLGFCVTIYGLPLHLNFFNVFPFVCNTERTQMAIAARSFAALRPFLLVLVRNVTEDLTFLIQWQNEVASGLELIFFFIFIFFIAY